MGFELVARKPAHPGASYLHVNIFQMIFLRSAMLAAGVKESLVNKKFLGNDGYLVTPLQSGMIAKKLKAWLKNRNLVVEMIENNERAREVNNAVLEVFQIVGDSGQKAMAKHYRRAKSIPLRLTRSSRKALRTFADFCEGSGGFRVQ
jgi:hypothetical protein